MPSWLAERWRKMFPPLPPAKVVYWLVRTGQYAQGFHLTEAGKQQAILTAMALRMEAGDDAKFIGLTPGLERMRRPDYTDFFRRLAENLGAATNEGLALSDQHYLYLAPLLKRTGEKVDTFWFDRLFREYGQLVDAEPDDTLNVFWVPNGSYITSVLSKFDSAAPIGPFGPPHGSAFGFEATVDRRTGRILSRDFTEIISSTEVE